MGLPAVSRLETRVTAETLRKWVRLAQRDAGHRPGLTTSERERLKELEREVRELKRVNEILGKASAYCAQAELDRRGKCWSASFRTIERSMGSSRSAWCCRLTPRRITVTGVPTENLVPPLCTLGIIEDLASAC